MRKKEGITVRAVLLLLSTGIHAVVLSAVTMPEPVAEERDLSYLELLTLSDFQPEPELPEQERRTPDPRDPDPEPKEPPEKIETVPEPDQIEALPRQIVDLGQPSPDDQAPDQDTRFLSQRDMKTDRETVRPSEARTGSPGDDPGRKPAQIEKPDTRPEQTRQRARTSRESPRPPAGPGSPSPPPAPELSPVHPGDRGIAPPGKQEEKDEFGIRKPPAPPGAGPTGQDLMLSMADLKKTYDSDHGSIEYMPDIPRGEITSLNARAYTYAAFFNRILKIIRFYWDPSAALRTINWTGGRLITQLRFVIDQEGGLVEVEVIRSCGYPVVDAEAVKAVRRAAPFYNVPPALLDERGVMVDTLSFIIY